MKKQTKLMWLPCSRSLRRMLHQLDRTYAKNRKFISNLSRQMEGNK